MQLPEGVGKRERDLGEGRAQKEAPSASTLSDSSVTRLEGQAAEEEARSGPTSVNFGAEATLGGTLSCPGWETRTCCLDRTLLSPGPGLPAHSQALPLLKGSRRSLGCRESNKDQWEVALRSWKGSLF